MGEFLGRCHYAASEKILFPAVYLFSMEIQRPDNGSFFLGKRDVRPGARVEGFFPRVPGPADGGAR